jgi:hypothetical protein
MELTIDWDYSNNSREKRVGGRITVKELKRMYKEDLSPVYISIQKNDVRRGRTDIVGELIDISSGGVCVKLDQNIPPGTFLNLRIVFGNIKVVTEGMVVYYDSSTEDNKTGIAFINLNEKTLDMINGVYVSKVLMYRIK